MEKKHPIGAQILSKRMMECTFPHTEDVLKTIDGFREVAASVHDDFNGKIKNNPNEALLDARGFNNAISILGSRGSGKTSVIMTLQHILKVGKENWKAGFVPEHIDESNIMMPILIPQDCSAKQTLLSWLIIQLLEKGEEIEREMQSVEQGCLDRFAFKRWLKQGETHFRRNPLRECMDSLKRSFELRYKSGLKARSEDLDQVYQYMEEVRRDSGLILDMLKLISMMADYYRYKASRGENDYNPKNEPLFFFVIDDLDLAPERSQEVLFLVLRYLQHPNVVVLSGWYEELFQNHLCIELLRNQGILRTDFLNTTFGYDDVFMKRRRQRVAALDSARRLAMDNLKKAFPPAQRYEIRSLRTEQRASFPVVIENDHGKSKEEDFLSFIEDTLKLFRADERVAFLHNYSQNYLKVYMRAFDNKARGMVNAAKAFKELREKAISWNGKGECKLTSSLLALVDALLFSNTRFAPYHCGLRDLIKIKQVILYSKDGSVDPICDCYFNFNGIPEVFNDYKEHAKYAKSKNMTDYKHKVQREYNYFPEVVLDVYILLNFMQNMVRCICNLPQYEHGGLDFSEVLNKIYNPVQINAASGALLAYAIRVAGLTSIQLFPSTYDFRINLNLLDAYEAKGLSDAQFDFTGSGSYCRLSTSILSIMGESKSVRSQQNSNADSASESGYINLAQKVPDWFETILTLFDALYFSNDNIRRTTKFRSLMLQEVYEYQTQAISAAKEPTSGIFEQVRREYTHPRKRFVTDKLLNDIVSCLRETDRLRRDFNAYKTGGKKYKNDKQRLNKDCHRAMEYLGLSISCNGSMDLESFDASEYYAKLKRIKSASDLFFEKESNDESFIAEALDYTNEDIAILLHFLQRAMETAVFARYPPERDKAKQFAFLLNASRAISYYVKQWNLGLGEWTDREDDAIEEMEALFLKHDFMEQFNKIRTLASLGPGLATGGREQYLGTLSAISNWVQDRLTIFEEEDQALIKNNLDILENAVARIRRQSIVENGIYSVLLELGKVIAQGCADLCIDEALLKDKTSAERDMTAWPIIEETRHEFDVWQNEFHVRAYLRKRRGDEKIQGTLFDITL